MEKRASSRMGAGDGEEATVTDPSVSHVFRSAFPTAEDAHFRTNAWIHGVALHPGELKPFHPTLLHALAHAAKMDDRTGITLLPEREGREVEFRSYRATFEAAKKVAANLRQAGIQRGDRVLIVLPTSHEFIATFFGVALAGGIPVPTYPPQSLRRETTIARLELLAKSAQVSATVTNQKISTFLGALGAQGKSLQRVLLAEALLVPTNVRVKTHVRRQDFAFIQFTSGSTGAPKGVALTHANLLANIHSIGQAMQLNQKDVVVSWLPLYHDMGLIGMLLSSMYWRLPLVLMSPLAFVSQPVRWLKAMSDYQGTLSAAPNFAYQMCTNRIPADAVKTLNLSSWRLALNGAEAIHLQTLNGFFERFGPQGFRTEAMLPVYGLAEASLAVSFPKLNQNLRVVHLDRRALGEGKVRHSTEKNAVALVSVGHAMPAHQVALVDERGEGVGPGRVGHILAKGPSIMSGYFQNPDATNKILKDGWLWTGDLGFVLEGDLFISGRTKDLIILRGRNYYPEDIERIAEQTPGVRPGGAFAFSAPQKDAAAGERAVLICETRVREPEERQKLIEQLTVRIEAQAELKLDEVVLAAPSTLPRTSSGKKERSRTRALYLQNNLPQAASKLRRTWMGLRVKAAFVVAALQNLWRPGPARS